MAGGFSILMVVRGLKATTAAYNANGDLLMLSAIMTDWRLLWKLGDSGDLCGFGYGFRLAQACETIWASHRSGATCWREDDFLTQNPSNARSDGLQRSTARRNHKHSKDHRSQYADAFLVMQVSQVSLVCFTSLV